MILAARGFLALDSEVQTLKSDVWIFIIFLKDEKHELTAKLNLGQFHLFEISQHPKQSNRSGKELPCCIRTQLVCEKIDWKNFRFWVFWGSFRRKTHIWNSSSTFFKYTFALDALLWLRKGIIKKKITQEKAKSHFVDNQPEAHDLSLSCSLLIFSKGCPDYRTGSERLKSMQTISTPNG